MLWGKQTNRHGYRTRYNHGEKKRVASVSLLRDHIQTKVTP